MQKREGDTKTGGISMATAIAKSKPYNVNKTITVPLFNQKTEKYDRNTRRYKLAIYIREGKGLQVAKIYDVVTGDGFTPHYKVSGVFDYSSIDILAKGCGDIVVVGKDFFTGDTPPESLDQININNLKGLVRIIKENYSGIRDRLPQDVISPVIYPDILSKPLPTINSYRALN